MATWAIFGLFIGSVFGVVIAVKKFQLSKKLVLYPVVITTFLFVVMGYINKPSKTSGNYIPFENTNESTLSNQANQPDFYELLADINVRSRPSGKSSKLFTLKKGISFEMMGSGYYDTKNNEWTKIIYNEQEGYVSSKHLRYLKVK